MGSPTIFNGDAVKLLKNVLKALNGQRLNFGSADPTSVAQTGTKGDLYISSHTTAYGVYQKTDSGSSTNWSRLDVAGSVAANMVSFTPAGTISATDVQAALAELDAEKQPLDADLTTISGLTATTDNFLQAKSSAWASRTAAQVKADLLDNVAALTSNTTLDNATDVALCNTASGGFNVTLPTAVGRAGKRYLIAKINSNSSAVQILSTSSQTINGADPASAPGFVMTAQWSFIAFISNGANWVVTAKNYPTAHLVTAITTLTERYETIECTATSSGYTITLPAANTCFYKTFTFIRTDNNPSNLITVDANASETISGSLTQILTNQNDSFSIYCNGTAWYLLDDARPLSGDVTNTAARVATVVTVGAYSAANVAAGATLANAASNLDGASTIVKRDSNKNFQVGNIHWTVGTVVTSGGTTTITNTQRLIAVFTGTLTHTYKLPAANTASAGATLTYRAINKSSGAVTVVDTGSNTLAVLASGTEGLFTTTDTSTANGVWGVAISLSNPLGTNGVATTLTGLPLSTGVTGTLPIVNGGTGQVTAAAAIAALTGLPVATFDTKTATFTAATTSKYISYGVSGGSGYTINLPAVASNAGQVYQFTKTDSTTSVFVLDGNSSELINGQLTQSLSMINDTLCLRCTGSAWEIVSDTRKILYTAKAATFTCETTHKNITYQLTGAGNYTINLPAVSGNDGQVYTFIKTDSSANVYQLDGSGSETIHGRTTQDIVCRYDFMTIYCNGVEWFIICDGRKPPTTAVTADTSVGLTYSTVRISAASAAVTITLPGAAGVTGLTYCFKRTDTTIANAVTIDGSGSETIDGALTKVLVGQYESITIQSNGTSWDILNANLTSAWIAYTPTFTGFGTAASVGFFWRRNGDSIQIKGRFVVGTPTATEARISLPTGVTSDTAKISSVFDNLGTMVRSASSALYFTTYALIEPTKTYMTVSRQTSTTDSTTKVNGDVFSASESLNLQCVTIPVAGW